MSLIFLLLSSILGHFPVIIRFRICCVSPEFFFDLLTPVATWLGVPEEYCEILDYEEAFPTLEPTSTPTEEPTSTPTEEPTTTPEPTSTPSEVPTDMPTETPTQEPSQAPTQTPTEFPSDTRRLVPVRRRLCLDDLNTLEVACNVEDQAAADDLIASVEAKQDELDELEEEIAEELDIDLGCIMINPTIIEYLATAHGDTNSVAGWVIVIAGLIAVIACVFIVTYGKNYKPSDAFWFEDSMESSGSTISQFETQ